MPYISISRDCKRKVLDHARASEGGEVIGLLLGRYIDQSLVIEDAIPGKGERDGERIILTGEELAKIADDILSGRVGGNVIGWYHSHPGRGVFLSDVDVSTQLKLQQFSPHVVSMVVDPEREEVGFFFVDPISREPHRVGKDEIFEFSPGEHPIPLALPQRPPPRRSPSARSIAIFALLMALIGSSILFLMIYSAPQVKQPTIQILPIPGAVVGEELEISAEVTEGSFGLGNVTLFYRTRAEAGWIAVRMDRRSGNIFSAKIPPSQITGDVAYFISAEDRVGNVVKSPLALAGLRSFELVGMRALARLYWDSGSEIRFGLVLINGFSSAVGFEVLGLPEGVIAEFEPAVAIPQGSGPVEVLLRLSPLGPSRPVPGGYRLLIRGTHGAFSRELQAYLLIPTFDLSLQPTSLKVTYGGIAKFNVSISRRYGFDRELRFEVRGLPSDIFETKLIVPEGISSAPESTMVLEVYVSPYARIGTYDFKLIVTGGGIEREASANLKVSRTRV